MALSTRQIVSAGQVLARAFHDDPAIVAVLRDETPPDFELWLMLQQTQGGRLS